MKIVLSSILVVFTLLAAPATADASPPSTSTQDELASVALTITGTPDDGLTQGRHIAFNEANARIISNPSDRGMSFSIYERGASDSWGLSFAPKRGTNFAVGKYVVPPDSETNADAPAFNLFRRDGFCKGTAAHFEIVRWVQQTADSVEELEMQFEQRCESFKDAVRGTLVVRNHPTPGRLSLRASISSQGRADLIDGSAGIDGTLTCSRNVDVEVRAQIVRIVAGRRIFDSATFSVPCVSSTVTPWAARVSSGLSRGGSFTPGMVRVYITAKATDAGGSTQTESSSKVELVPFDTRRGLWGG